MTETARETGLPVSRGTVMWPTLTAIGCLFGFGCAASYLVFMGLPFLLAGVVAAVVAAAMAAVSLRRRRRLRAVSYLVLPGVVVASVIAPQGVLGAFVRVGQCLRLLTHLRSYDAEIERSTLPVGSRFKVFDWGGFAGYNTFLIYDETGAIERPQARAWRGAEDGGVSASCAGRVVRLTGHFYICDT
jgi:hypothetical protein